MTSFVSLPVLLSRTLGHLRTQLEQEATSPAMPALPMWSNLLRCVAATEAEGVDERVLPEAARISRRMAVAAVTAAVGQGWLTADAGGGKHRHLQLTGAGRTATETWPRRLSDLDAAWDKGPLRPSWKISSAAFPWSFRTIP